MAPQFVADEFLYSREEIVCSTSARYKFITHRHVLSGESFEIKIVY